jgi:hypothetical protein
VGSLKDEESACGFSPVLPSGPTKTKARDGCPDSLRIDECVTPQTRTAVTSDGVSLSDKEGRKVRTLVAKERALDAFLLVSTVDGSPPNKGSITLGRSQDDFVARADNEVTCAPRFSGGVVPPVEVADSEIAVFREPPQRPFAKGS